MFLGHVLMCLLCLSVAHCYLFLCLQSVNHVVLILYHVNSILSFRDMFIEFSVILKHLLSFL